MLALCLMLSGTYYAKNYAGIIGRGLFMWFYTNYGFWFIRMQLSLIQMHLGESSSWQSWIAIVQRILDILMILWWLL